MALGGEDLSVTEESLDELDRLARTAGAKSVGRIVQALDSPSASTYVGSGKAAELAAMVASASAQLVIFDEELRPGQQSNLEELTGVKVVDRTALILDIFAQHAHSAEGKLQVELAQQRYLLTRLTGKGTALSRLGGGIGTRGPGEQQLEVDRRRIRERIAALERSLALSDRTRTVKRKRRVSSGVSRVSLVGYTNAGKSTLMRRLTVAGVVVKDQLFSTVDSVSARFEIPGGRPAVLTDTVGFVRKLPHELIDAFRSTLDEVRDADLLLHVVDASARRPESQVEAVRSVLAEIDADSVPELLVLNKIDIASTEDIERAGRLGESLAVSAATGEGIDRLVEVIAEMLGRQDIELRLRIPYTSGGVAAQLRDDASVVSEHHEADGIYLEVRMPRRQVSKYSEFVL